MNRMILLGVGNGRAQRYYNTCFMIQNEEGNFLVDTGGGIELFTRLEKAGIDFMNIRHIFISHNHTDHILGIFWFFKLISRPARVGEITEPIYIYCNDVVHETIVEVADRILPMQLMKAVYQVVRFVVLKDQEQHTINGISYTFFDTKAIETKQYGFVCHMNGKRFVFLGDETLKPELYEFVRGADYVCHEAFCLDEEEHIFHAYEKFHSTVKSACEIMNALEVQNLILYHTEETHGKDRHKLYLEEGRQFFDGNLLVPEELDVIELERSCDH